jgi:hypothetical protein
VSGEKCEPCGASFHFREDLIKHNVGDHGAALGKQLRNSEEIRKQRARIRAKVLLDLA